MKKVISVILATALAISCIIGLSACGSDDTITVAIPNDTTNEARALLLLEELGVITLKDGAGITATVRDIESNPKNIEFKEVEAAQLPNMLADVDYAVINANYALAADIKPIENALEGSASAYGNVLVVKEGNENEPKIKALKAALESQKVADFINEHYNGAVISVVDNPGTGFAADVDYAALAGTKITVAASPAPHAEILAIAKEILAEKDIELVIEEYPDYVIPNDVVESGEKDANYFQHVPYLDDFNAEKGYHLIAISTVHVEPLGVYSEKNTTIDAIKG